MNFWEVAEEYLEGAGLSRPGFRSLREFIEAPDDPIEFDEVLANLESLLPTFHDVARGYGGFTAPSGHHEWIDICRTMLAHPRLAELLEPYRGPGSMPLRGYYRTNQIYVALWELSSDGNESEEYHRTLCHCLIAVSILKERMGRSAGDQVTGTTRSNYENSIYNSILFVRKIDPETLQGFPSHETEAEELNKALRKTDDSLFAPLKVLYRYLLEVTRPPRKHGRRGIRVGRRAAAALSLPTRAVALERNLDPEQRATPLASVEVHQLPALTRGEAEVAERLGCSPEESSSGIEIASPRRVGTTRGTVRTPTQKAIFARQAKTHLAMQNQRLPGRWEGLSGFEASAFLEALDSLYHNDVLCPYRPRNAGVPELGALLTTLFWFGQRLEAATKLRFYPRPPTELPAEPGFVAAGQDKGYWLAAPATPARTRSLTRAQRVQTLPTVPNFKVQTAHGVERVIRKYATNARSPSSELLFPRPEETYQEWISHFLAAVNRRSHTRLTANRVSDYVFDKIAHHEGSDLTAAMYIVGREHYLGRNPSYYTATPTARLERIYREVCKGIFERHGRERKQEGPRAPETPLGGRAASDDDVCVGSPFRPKQAAVRNLVRSLLRTFDEARGAPPDPHKLYRLHNNMTRYTAYLISFGTGFRAVRDPFLSAARIDWKTGFAVLSDKDNEDRYNSRLIWIPPVCLTQLRLFREHEVNVRARLLPQIPDLIEKAGRCRRDPGAVSSYFVAKKRGSLPTAVSASPNRREYRVELYSLPFNASRHYLRSTLLDVGCPLEVINAFMGHFERGEEPWGNFSALSPLTYRRELEATLVPLLKNDGWVPMEGVGLVL